MPPLSILFVRASFIYLLIGFAAGAALSLQRGMPFQQAIWKLWSVHVEFLVFGWMVQLAMGVAFWILPRFFAGPPRGNERPMWAAFYLLNLGVCFCGLAPAAGLPLFLSLAGRSCELLSAVCFAVHAWPRVRKSDDICRADKGETAS